MPPTSSRSSTAPGSSRCPPTWTRATSTPAAQLERPWSFVGPPLVTAAVSLLVGLLAASELSPLGWATLIVERAYSAMTAALLALALLVPLTIAALPIVRPWRDIALTLLPLAPLPALVAALVVPQGTTLSLPDLLLGAAIGIDGEARLFLVLAGLLWSAAGLYASHHSPTTSAAAASPPSGA
jgi:hypothetical protein